MSTNEGGADGPRAKPGRRDRTRTLRAGDFERAYRTMTPDWDIGRPQSAFLDLSRSGAIGGRVLDVGCGTGEHVLMAAAMGLDAIGIDVSPTAIGVAEGKARARGLPARFLVLDALRMAALDEQFDTVLDCGMFHVLGDEDRLAFADSLRSVLRPGGRYFMLCFSDQQPGFGAARRISQQEINATFGDVLHIDSIEPARQEEKLRPTGLQAWLVKITRTARPTT